MRTFAATRSDSGNFPKEEGTRPPNRKLEGTQTQYRIIDEILRTALFVRNKVWRYWMDNPGVNGYALNKYCKVLADNPEFP